VDHKESTTIEFVFKVIFFPKPKLSMCDENIQLFKLMKSDAFNTRYPTFISGGLAKAISAIPAGGYLLEI